MSSLGPSATVLVTVSSYASSAFSFSPVRIRKSARARYASRISLSPSFSSAFLIFSPSDSSSAAFTFSMAASFAASTGHPSCSHTSL